VTIANGGSFSPFDTFTRNDSFVCCVTIAFFDSFVLYGILGSLNSFRSLGTVGTLDPNNSFS